MKQIIIIALLLKSGILFSQSFTKNCFLEDTTDFRKLKKLIKEEKDEFFSSIISGPKAFERDRYCNLLAYAVIFDYYLERGVSLNYKAPREARIRENLAELTEEQIKRKHEINEIDSRFRRCVNINEIYDRFILKKLKKEEISDFQKDIEKILANGIYYDPISLRKILLGECKKLSLDYISKEFLNPSKD